EIQKHALRAVELVAEVREHEAVDFLDGDPWMSAELVDQELVRSSRNHDAHLVAGLQQVLDDDAAARRMTHAFADDAVEDAHVPSSLGSSASAGKRPDRCRSACTSGGFACA